MYSLTTRNQYRNIKKESQNVLKLWNLLLNGLFIKEEITIKIRKYFELKNNKNKTYQNLWSAAKAVLRRIVMASNEYIRKEERLKMNTLSFHFMKLEEERIKLKFN